MKIGGLSLKAETKRISSIRDAVGPKIRLMADANRAYTLQDAVEIGSVLAAHNFFWFEEPLNSTDVQKHIALRKRSRVMLAAGERWNVAEFETFLHACAVDIAQPNVGNIGGFHNASRVMQLAGSLGIQVALHSWGTPVALAAAIHLASSASGSDPPIVEFDCTSNPLRHIVQEPIPLPINGYFLIPETPGLGISINEALLKRFCTNT
jgi:D-galactarolactone cycloisomerase